MADDSEKIILAVEDVIERDDYVEITMIMDLDGGYDISQDDDLIYHFLHFGNEETVIFLLKNGANPNSIVNPKPQKIDMEYMLASAGTAPMILALLSHGADPNDCYGWEYTRAIIHDDWLHLVLYFFYFHENIRIPRPSNADELHEAISRFPMDDVNYMVSQLRLMGIRAEAGLEPEQENLLSPIFQRFFQSLK